MSTKKNEKMRPLWSFEACEMCGEEGYATRTMPRPASEPYICGECESTERSYSEGYDSGYNACISSYGAGGFVDWLADAYGFERVKGAVSQRKVAKVVASIMRRMTEKEICSLVELLSSEEPEHVAVLCDILKEYKWDEVV